MFRGYSERIFGLTPNRLKRLLIITLLSASALACYAQGRPVLAPEKMMKLVPEKIKGFYVDGDAKSRLIQLGDISYSIAERSFSNNRKKIKILLFDYNNAEIQYTQATRKWKDLPPAETDSLSQQRLVLTNCEGWESYNKTNNSSQIFLGICQRFFLIISGDHVDIETLHQVVGLFDMTRFPNPEFAVENKK